MIKAKDLVKKFGNITAVNNVSLDIKDGEIFGLLGPNGAGKTTIVRMLATLIQPTSGTITVNKISSRTEPSRIREIIGLLTETPGMYEKLSAVDNLRYFAGFYNTEPHIITANIEKMLKMFDLWDRKDDMVATFSKGMKQKLAISRALIHEPKILFLDEPTAGLDPESAFMVRNFIESLKNDKITILLCTHNLEEAQSLCDTVCIIKNRVIKTASIKDLENLKTVRTFTLKLKNYSDKIKSVLDNFKNCLSYQADSEKIILSINNFEQNNPLLIRELVKNNAEIIYFNEKKESLEEIYLELVKK